MDSENEGGPPTKKADVGYKRPPVEHQFKPGQKPPARKPRAGKHMSTTQLFAKILAEERRLKRGDRASWYSNGYLLVEVAFQLAEEGNSSVARALTEYLISGDPPAMLGTEPILQLDPDGPCGVFNYTIRYNV